MGKLMIPLADGLEEIEAITNIDVLRRANLDVLTVSLTDDLKVKGGHEISIMADDYLDKIEVDEISGIILPGGMPGANNLKNSQKLLELINLVNEKQGLIAAVCAAPIVLEAAGILGNRAATSYPGFEDKMPSCNYQEQRVVVDENIITARGPGVAMEFAFSIVGYLSNHDKVEKLKENMLAK